MPAREYAIRQLTPLVKRFPDIGPTTIDADGLAPRDRALARAIEQAALRHWRALAAVLGRHIERGWHRVDPPVRAALLTGAAQLYMLDGIPDHAAIGTSVEAVKRVASGRTAGFVNAILRRTAESRGERLDTFDPDARDQLPRSDGGAWRLTEAILPEDPTERLAVQTSHATPLVAHWTAAFGADEAASIARHDLVQPPVIVAGASDSPGLEPHRESGFHIVTGGADALDAALASSPAARVQDPAAAEPVKLTTSLEPKLIVDACAGRGTKTGQLADIHPNARIIATDVDHERRASLAAAFADHDRVDVVAPESLGDYRGETDLLVLDVPCSNTAVLARRLGARYRFGPKSLEDLVAVQRQIVADTFALLSDEGRLLYATCSLEAAENERQVERVASLHRMRVESTTRRMPAGLPGDPPAMYSDGGFSAMLGPA